MATNSREIGELTLALAAEIRVRRAERRWKQSELETRTGIPATTISRMENGLVAIDAEQIAKLGAAFGMSAPRFVAAAVEHAEERQRQGEVYLPDGTVDPVAGTTTATSEERRAALRARKTRPSE